MNLERHRSGDDQLRGFTYRKQVHELGCVPGTLEGAEVAVPQGVRGHRVAVAEGDVRTHGEPVDSAVRGDQILAGHLRDKAAGHALKDAVDRLHPVIHRHLVDLDHRIIGSVRAEGYRVQGIDVGVETYDNAAAVAASASSGCRAAAGLQQSSRQRDTQAEGHTPGEYLTTRDTFADGNGARQDHRHRGHLPCLHHETPWRTVSHRPREVNM